MDDKTLSHHGIKGMKWGIWNDETRARRLGSGKKNRASNDKKAVRDRAKERKKAVANASLLSDKDLDKMLKRLEKEKRLRDLSNEVLSPGKKATKDLLASNGAKIAGIAVGLVATAIVQDQLAKRGFGKEAIKAKDKKKAEALAQSAVDSLTSTPSSSVSKIVNSKSMKNAINSLDSKLEPADTVVREVIDAMGRKKGSSSWLSGTMR